MAPDKFMQGFDPNATPFLLGMVIKVKNWAELKGMAAFMAFLVTSSFGIGLFYSQTNAMMVKQDEYIAKVERLEEAILSIQRSLDITNNNVGYIRKDIDRLTAQVGEIISDRVKLRR